MVARGRLAKGKLKLGKVAGLLNAAPRTLNAVTGDVLDSGILTPDSRKSTIKLVLPVTLPPERIPGFFLEAGRTQQVIIAIATSQGYYLKAQCNFTNYLNSEFLTGA